ncbi:hypothetical protein J5X91_09885 [Pseudoalteromonas sp. K222D]|uniref:hypothetical protein n=1 Tax=Pseudoalteromonas sp. K222D TaxID=2820756 RepID=UPI001AD7A322|nr:hypothetical protein [Pseudoalteromonas sp. K222D]MBO7926575.1 hypothetical protein [Pseudoalteromonas sp. K222D]
MSEQIKFGALLSYGTIVFSVVAGIIYTPWLVSEIGMSEYGIYVLAMSVLTYFSFDFGLGEAVARYVAKYRSQGEHKKISALLGLTAKIYFLGNLLVLLGLIVFYFFIDGFFTELSLQEVSTFKEIYIVSGFFIVVSFQFLPINGVLLAYEKFVLLKSLDLFVKVSTIMLMVVAILLGHKVFALVTINILIGSVVIIFKVIYLIRYTPVGISFTSTEPGLLKDMAGFTGWTTLTLLAQRLLMSLAPTILAVYSGSQQIAIFAIGMLIEGYVWTFANALNGLFLARVTGLASEQNGVDKITRLMVVVGRMQLILISSLCIGLVFFGAEFINLWMGNGFSESYIVMLLLVLPTIISVTQQIASTHLVVNNKIRLQSILFMISSAFGLSISLFLVEDLGAIGVATGIMIATILGKIVVPNFIFNKYLDINLIYFFKETYFKLAIPLLLSISTAWVISVSIPESNFILFVIKSLLFLFAYGVIIWLLGINKEEKNQLAKLFQ